MQKGHKVWKADGVKFNYSKWNILRKIRQLITKISFKTQHLLEMLAHYKF